MQTFLPYREFEKSAKCLDRQRLGKQRVEVLQILKAINGESKGWTNHPATNMWKDYKNALIIYGVTVCNEWIERGYKDTCKDKILNYFSAENLDFTLPYWLGDPRIHLGHQSNLVRKDPVHYQPIFPKVGPNLPYFWPNAK